MQRCGLATGLPRCTVRCLVVLGRRSGSGKLLPAVEKVCTVSASAESGAAAWPRWGKPARCARGGSLTWWRGGVILLGIRLALDCCSPHPIPADCPNLAFRPPANSRPRPHQAASCGWPESSGWRAGFQPIRCPARPTPSAAAAEIWTWTPPPQPSPGLVSLLLAGPQPAAKPVLTGPRPTGSLASRSARNCA